MYRVACTTAIAAAALALTGCAGATENDQPEAAATVTETTAPVLTPTRIDAPEPLESCTVSVETTEGSDHPDRARIACGTEDPITVGGDFREKVTNSYDPATAAGVARVLIVGDDARVWTEACFLSYDMAAGDPVACEAPGGQATQSGTDEPLSPEGLAEQHA